MPAQPARSDPAAHGATERRVVPRTSEPTDPGSTVLPPRPRRVTSGRRGSDSPILPDGIEPNWIMMAPIFAVAMLINGIATRTLPGGLVLSGWLVAIGLSALTPWFVRYEKTRLDTARARNLANVLIVALPMFMIGVSIARWTAHANVSWADAIGSLVIVSTMAAIILHRRVSTLIISKVAIWSGLTMEAGRSGAWFALSVGIAIAIYTAFRQANTDHEEAQQRRDREHVQRRAEEILNEFEQTGQGWFWETDRRGALVYVSATVGAVLQSKQDDLIGCQLAALFESDANGHDGERSLAFHLSSRSSFVELALRAASREEERWWSVSGRPIYDGFGNFLGFRGSGHDLTEKRRSAEQVSRLAHFDSLTGLANRLQIAQTLEKILTAPKLDQRACAVFLLDLDRFKQVNDTMGHPAGDSLLTQVATRLERAVGQSGRVGRLGGDEFQVILHGRRRREELAALAQQIIHDLSQPYSVDGHRVMIGASVGIAISPDDGVTAEAIIRNADLALYAAKDGGRGRHHFYAADLHSDAEERRQLEQDLRDALIGGGLELHYQPVVHTVTERITGFEALLRWNHPTRGWLSPAKFIPVAEDSGLIAQIGEWALRTACRDLAAWPEDVRVAVNVSPLQFSNPTLPAIITNALASAQVQPSRLELEITESVFLSDNEGVDAMFAALKRVGVRLALDDFGTGYSALGYLKKAPFDKIKIDQSFVRGATIAGSRNGAIIASIVSLAEALGMETTAEGVETLDELDLVRMLGCSHVQGYIYEKALSRSDASHRLATGLTAVARGPRSARAARHRMLRKVVLEHGGQKYQGTIRNISTTGALIEGLWNVPPGTIFTIMLGEGHAVTATARWCQQDRTGMEFASALPLDGNGRIALVSGGVAEPGGGGGLHGAAPFAA